MPAKRTTTKFPAKAGARTNKQRITKLTRREIAAHEATGGWWGPGTVPRDATLHVLNTHGIVGDDAESLIAACVDPLGRFLMDDNFRQKRLTPAEMVKQARDTAAVAEELGKRIRNMDPHIRAHVVGKAYATWRDLAFPESLEPTLTKLQVVCQFVAKELDKIPSKVPKRTGARNVLLADVICILAPHVATKVKQRKVACELLTAWGVDTPVTDHKVRKAIRGRGTK